MRAISLAKTLGLPVALLLTMQQANAACIAPPISDKAISDFRSSPQSMVAPDSDTRTIEQVARDLAATDAALASELIAVAKETNARFRSAIAAGLAQAAVACSTVDQQAAQTIQQAVAGFEDGAFQASFAAVAGDLSTAATEMAAASATSSAGSVIVTNPNRSARTATSPGSGGGGGGAVGALQLTTSGFSIGNANTGSASSPSTTAASSVSPTR